MRLKIVPALFVAAALLSATVSLHLPVARGEADPVVAAAGDIVCDSRYGTPTGEDEGAVVCHHAGTFALLTKLHPDAILTLGDEQYEQASYDAFMSMYDKTWGQFKAITHPRAGESRIRYFGRSRLL
jgi:hypothetical protein